MKKFFVFAVFACLTNSAFAWTDTEIVNAIGRAENSTAHPYGIMQKYKNTTPRQACFNTIHHIMRCWNGKGDFIAYCGSIYAPVGAGNDPGGLNKNWVKNVKYFLAHP